MATRVLKDIGDEPIFTGPVDNSAYIDALNWYSYMSTPEDIREYLSSYLTKKDRHSDLEKVMKVSDTWIPKTVGSMARIMTNGGILSDTSKAFFEKKLQEVISHAPVEDNKIILSDRIKSRANEIIGEIEEMIDHGTSFSTLDWLKEKQIPASYVSYIINKYEPILEELNLALEGEDEQIVESYEHLSEGQLEGRIALYTSIIDDASTYGQLVKKVRKPRKKKKIPVEKQIKNLKFQKEDKEMKLVSIKPEKIVGAAELWTYNTKYKLLTVLRSSDTMGLQVKGTSIINYDENSSETKRTGRKSDYFVKSVMTGGKVALRKIMSESKYDALLGHRINENTILLRVL